jgi:hypothetical protein
LLPLQQAYNVTTQELESTKTTKDLRLQMAVKAVNDTAGYDGLVPTLLVFGAFPRISSAYAPSLTTTQRAKAIKEAMSSLAKLRAERKVTDALRLRNGPNVEGLHDLTLGSEVLVYRTTDDRWHGPYTLLGIEGSTCKLQIDQKVKDFRITDVKPYEIAEQQSDDEETDALKPDKQSPEDQRTTERADITSTANERKDVLTKGQITSHTEALPESDRSPSHRQKRQRRPAGPARDKQPRERKLPSRFAPETTINVVDAAAVPDLTIFISEAPTPPKPDYSSSRLKELEGLLNNHVFEVVDARDVPANARVFGTRFVDSMKNEGTDKAFEKSRLVVQAFNDPGKETILTQAPTIQRSSQRLVLVVSLILGISIYLRDISQAYTQSETLLNREIYARAPPEMKLPHSTLIRIRSPLYGIPEAGTHWYKTYHRHHTEKLRMKASTYDPCLLIAENRTAIVGLQTDDSLIAATPEFMVEEDLQLQLAKLLAKPVEQLTPEHPIDFNGFIITMDGSDLTISQDKQIKQIELLQKDFTKSQYVKERARAAYVATVSQPQAAFELSYAAQITEPTYDDVQYLNRCLQWQMKGSGLRFVKLDEKTLRIVTFTDASFANNKDHSSQIGYVIVLADADNNANVIHWQSKKCKRVTRSVLASELYALSLGFDN